MRTTICLPALHVSSLIATFKLIEFPSLLVINLPCPPCLPLADSVGCRSPPGRARVPLVAGNLLDTYVLQECC